MSVLVECREISKTIEYLVYGEIEEFEKYVELFKSLETASEKDQILIKLNSPGGLVDIGMMICSAIKQSAAKVSIEVVYPCYSIGALIALSGDQLIFNKNTFLMFHDYSGGIYGKGNEQEKSCIEYNKIWRNQFIDTCCPFLSKREAEAVLNGLDIYIHHDDSNIYKRINRHFILK